MRVRRARQQQHRRRHVRHQVRQHHAQAEQGGGPGGVDAVGAHERDGRVHRPRLLEGVVDDEQADEQHQQLPVDERHHLARGHAPRQQQHAGAAERDPLARQARHEQERDHQHHRHRQALEALPAVEGWGGDLRRGQLAPPAAAELEGDHRPGRAQAEQHRHARIDQIAGERQAEGLPDQDVLRVADQRRRRTDVRGAGEREQERHRVEATARAALDQHGRHRQADDVVGQHRAEEAGQADDQPEQPRRRDVRRHHPARHVRVEPRQPELRGDHHHREQQVQRRHVDARPGAPERLAPHRDDAYRAQQRHARAVQRQPGDLAEDHAEVDEPEDDEGGGVHRRPSNLTGAASDCTVSSGGQLR